MYFYVSQQQEIFQDICTSDEPYLGLGPNLVNETNSNVTLLNRRIALGTKGKRCLNKIKMQCLTREFICFINSRRRE